MNDTITEEHFPTSVLRLTSNDPAVVERERQLARAQVLAAEEMLWLMDQIGTIDYESRLSMLDGVHDRLRLWRHGHAAATEVPAAFPTAVGFLSRRRTPDFTVGPLRLGAAGGLRDGAQWDASQRTFVGGEPTPASRLAEELGQQILQRFENEAPHAVQLAPFWITTDSGHDLLGARLLRGDAAQSALAAFAQRELFNGRTAEGIDLGGEAICVAPASMTNQEYLYLSARELLADESCDLREWAEAAYLLAQAPLDRCGSAEVHRMFIVSVGAAIFGTVPELPSDCAVRALITPRQEFVDELVALQG